MEDVGPVLGLLISRLARLRHSAQLALGRLRPACQHIYLLPIVAVDLGNQVEDPFRLVRCFGMHAREPRNQLPGILSSMMFCFSQSCSRWSTWGRAVSGHRIVPVYCGYVLRTNALKRACKRAVRVQGAS
uniref:Uncharacterized protein n=1 Tax=Tetraselmis sp. GSL018 TaxID=582737 RepID=A0A061QNF9_9CHLO